MIFNLKTLNLKTLSLCGLAALAMIAAPLGVVQLAHAQEEGGQRGSRGPGHRLERMAEALNLTEAQTAEIEAIHTAGRAQVQSILTAEQRSTLQNSEQRGRRAFRELDLSEDQRAQMRSIREASREQVQSVLTAEQREQAEALHEQRHQGREGRRGREGREGRRAQ